MERKSFLELLGEHGWRYSEDAERVERFRHFVSEREDCFSRSCEPGHITASAWISSADGERFLLTHHRKLGRWLQLGGHADGDYRVDEVALREAREESGMWDFDFVGNHGMPRVIDLDIHVIPARGEEPEHLHYDVRFALVAGAGQELVQSAESHALAWFPVEQLEQRVCEESLLRLGRRALSRLGSGTEVQPC